ncbi:hypothetical protein [Methylobacterium nigriterrae]|uniref:hypothetical protein n=1 Tax=Methylobacterium nigriterrae TaxID=3127512 RepID=UPI003013EDB4
MRSLRIVAALCACLAAAPVRADGSKAAGFGMMRCSEANELFEQLIYRTAFLG